MSVKTILVSLPEPENKKSPFFELAEKCKLKIDFRPFTHVEGLTSKEFREQKINLAEHTAIIFTSKVAVDHFFRILGELRYEIPQTIKFFCISETVAYYLQRYIAYRKRKIFIGNKLITDLIPAMKKHKNEKFLLPCANMLRDKIPETLEENKIQFTKAILYNTVVSDLSDLENVYYDMLVFFNPSGIESLLKNFPDFKQNQTKIAAFGSTTANAVLENNLRLDVLAPQPEAPSMVQAIELFIKKKQDRLM